MYTVTKLKTQQTHQLILPWRSGRGWLDLVLCVACGVYRLVKTGELTGQAVDGKALPPVFMYEGIEGEAVPPGSSKVTNVNVRVSSRLHLTPEQEGVFSRPLLTRLVLLLDTNVLNLKHTDTALCSLWRRGGSHSFEN